jgi:hypothetical protein
MPGESSEINWSFHPVECLNYHLQVSLRAKNGNISRLTLRGIGVSKRSEESKAIEVPIFKGSSLELFSINKILEEPFIEPTMIKIKGLLGHSSTSRVVTIHNPWQKDVHYSWKMVQRNNSVAILPKSGQIKPGQSQLVSIIIHGGIYVGVNVHQLTCQFSAAPFSVRGLRPVSFYKYPFRVLHRYLLVLIIFCRKRLFLSAWENIAIFFLLSMRSKINVNN